MNVNEDTDVQGGEHFEVKKWYFSVYLQDMTRINEKHIVFLQLMED